MEKEKRLFEVLDAMNVKDETEGTRTVCVCPTVLSVDQTSKGTKVTIGVPAGTVNVNSDQRIILLVIDGKEYEKQLS